MSSCSLALAEVSSDRSHDIALPLQILLAEDDDGDAYLIERALLRHSRQHQVLRAVDGIEALEMLAQGAMPDLAIVDLHMPRKDGFTLLVDMVDLKSTFPVIVLTSSTAPSDSIRSRLQGADYFLAKPDGVEEFHTALTKAIAAVHPS